jgi:hypothetical protein
MAVDIDIVRDFVFRVDFELSEGNAGIAQTVDRVSRHRTLAADTSRRRKFQPDLHWKNELPLADFARQAPQAALMNPGTLYGLPQLLDLSI